MIKMMKNDAYDQAGIRDLLSSGWIGRSLKFYDITDSTNLRARAEAECGAPHGTLIVADMQTAGIGRRGRSWESPSGVNLYFTLVLRPDFSQEKAPMLTLVMAHAVCRGIARESGLDCKIKWPNDIVVNGRKVCGILTQMGFDQSSGYYVVVGVGVNAGRQEFAPELLQKATSLEAEADRAVSRSRLLAAILHAFEADYETFTTSQSLKDILDSYNHMLVNRNAAVRVLDPKGEYDGVARGITETGELLVEKADGAVEQVYAGEVSVRGIYGYV